MVNSRVPNPASSNLKPASLYSLLVALAIFLRIILIFNPGFEADISFWKSWGLATYDKGIVEGMKVTNNNYPTPFAYALGSMVFFYNIIADPHNFNEFWKNTNVLFLAISKAFPIIADFGIAFLIVYIGKFAARLGFPGVKNGRAVSPHAANAGLPDMFGLSFYELASILYILNPIALIDGAWWGQVDSLGLFIFLCSVLLALSKRPFMAGLIFMLSMMTKLQNMIYGPVFFLFVWQLAGYNGIIRAVAGAVIGFMGLNIEFFLTKNMNRVLASLTENYDYFPWMSLNAFNLWWIVAGGRGMQISDKIAVLGMLTAKTVGLILFSSFYLFSVVRQFLSGFLPYQESSSMHHGTNIANKKYDTDNANQQANHAADKRRVLQTFLESLIVVNAAFFLFQTQSHDRYAFPLIAFLLLWLPFYLTSQTSEAGRQRRFRLFSMFYLLFTAFYFYNLHYALVVNYPANGLPVLSSLTQPVFSISTALVLLSLFGIFLAALIRQSRSTCYVLGGTGIVCISALLFLNKPLITKQPVSLTKIAPYISEQAYGTRQTNRSVQSSFGNPNDWNRLSVQYAFYRNGIGSHANSKYVFDIHGLFRTFTTDYGIDTESGSKASATFEIYGDEKLLYQSPKMGRFDLPKHVSVPISGVNSLMLKTTDSGDGNYDDHTDWLNPQLWP